MFVVHWQGSFEGLSLTQQSYSWGAGETLVENPTQFNIMQACVRRPVQAQMVSPISSERRFGRLVLTPADYEMVVETIGEETDFPVRKFELDSKWLAKLAASFVNFDFNQFTAQPVFDDPQVGGTLDRIYAEMTAPERASHDVLEALLKILAIDTARLLTVRSRRDTACALTLTTEQLARVRLSIETTDFKTLTPAKIAEDCEMSLRRLRGAFRRTTGSSLHDQIEQARQASACRSLVETGHPLKVISHGLGFAHSSAFCYWFKNGTGLTPTEYRLRNAVTCEGSC